MSYNERYYSRRRAIRGGAAIGGSLLLGVAYEAGRGWRDVNAAIDFLQGQTGDPSNGKLAEDGRIPDTSESVVSETVVPTPDPLKNFDAVSNMREGETRTFNDFTIDVVWVLEGVGTEAFVAASTIPSDDGVRREPYAAVVNAQCIYDAVREMDQFKNGDRIDSSLVPGQKLTRVILQKPVVFAKVTAQAERNLPYDLRGRVVTLAVVEDENGNQVSCDDNNVVQTALVTPLIEGREFLSISNSQPESR